MGKQPPQQVRAPKSRDTQQYAYAKKMLGNRRLTVDCQDGKERMAIIPGKFKGRKYWVSPGMLLLVNNRGYQDDKVDVIYVYSQAEEKQLKRKGELDDFKEKKVEGDVLFDELSEEPDVDNL